MLLSLIDGTRVFLLLLLLHPLTAKRRTDPRQCAAFARGGFLFAFPPRHFLPSLSTHSCRLLSPPSEIYPSRTSSSSSARGRPRGRGAAGKQKPRGVCFLPFPSLVPTFCLCQKLLFALCTTTSSSSPSGRPPAERSHKHFFRCRDAGAQETLGDLLKNSLAAAKTAFA